MALPSGSRVDLRAISRFADFRENKLGLSKVGILDGWLQIRCSSRMMLDSRE